MPDFIDLTVRVRKEKLGDMVTDMPSYCQPIRWSIVKEINVEPVKPKTLPPWVAKIVDEPRKPKFKRRWRNLPDNLANQILTLKKEGMKVPEIAAKLKVSRSLIYKRTKAGV